MTESYSRILRKYVDRHLLLLLLLLVSSGQARVAGTWLECVKYFLSTTW